MPYPPQELPVPRGPHRLRSCALFALALLLALQSACSTLPPPVAGRDYAAGTGRLAVVASDQPPEVEFEGFARSKGEGALESAGTTFAACLSGFGQGSCSGSGCGAALALLLGICSVASVVGGIAGAVSAPDAQAARSAQSDLRAVADPLAAQEALRQQVVSAAILNGAVLVDVPADEAREALRAGSYRTLAVMGADEVLEVRLLKAGTMGVGGNEPVTGYMKARVRLLRASDDHELFSSDFMFLGRRLRFAEWSANQGKPLLDMLRSGYETLAQQIYERTFLLHSFPDRQPHAAGVLAASFGLAPLYPATRGQLSGAGYLAEHFEWTTVDGLQPTLAWQSFPRETDVKIDPETMAKVRNVRYDLIVAREENLVPAEIVYRREGLPTARHMLEAPLRSGNHYFWSVRARFELNGQERVTEWSATRAPTTEQLNAPSPLSYRFKTR